MKRIALFLTLAAILMTIMSCGNKRQQQAQGIEIPDHRSEFSKDDTLEIQSLVSQFVTRMEKKDIRGAVEMLSFLAEHDSIVPLEPLFQRRQAMSLATVQGVNFEFKHMILRSNTNNEVKIDVTLFEKEPGDPKPNMTSLFLRPVKFEGKWYLTVWDNITNTNDDRNKD